MIRFAMKFSKILFEITAKGLYATPTDSLFGFTKVALACRAQREQQNGGLGSRMLLSNEIDLFRSF